MPVLDGNLIVKNAPKLSEKYLQDKICTIKQVQNIPVTLRTFLNQPKIFYKNLTLNGTPLRLSHLKLKPKFPTVRQFERNNTTFSKLRFL